MKKALTTGMVRAKVALMMKKETTNQTAALALQAEENHYERRLLNRKHRTIGEPYAQRTY
jgi:hypothetical protein